MYGYVLHIYGGYPFVMYCNEKNPYIQGLVICNSVPYCVTDFLLLLFFVFLAMQDNSYLDEFFIFIYLFIYLLIVPNM